MQRVNALLIAMVLMAGLMGMGWTSQASAVITIRVADVYPAGHPIRIGTCEFFQKEVEKRAKGKVKFDYYPHSTLVKGPDIADAVAAGTAHIGVMLYAAKVPLQFFPQLPGAYSDEETVAASVAMWKFAKTSVVEKEFEKVGLKLVTGITTPTYQIMTTRRVIRTIGDLKGLKVRVAGSILPKTIAAVGAVPVSMAIGEAYEAMERGILDGIGISIPSVKAYAFYDLIKYACINLDMGGYPAFYAINKKFWDGLPADVKKIMDDVGDLAAKHGAQYDLNEVKKDLETWKAKGIELTRISTADKKELNRRMAPVWDSWIEDMEKRGYPARQMVKDWKAALKEQKTEVGF